MVTNQGDLESRLVEHSPLPMLVVEGTGKILYSNEATSSLFGVEPESLEGKSVRVFIPEYNPSYARQRTVVRVSEGKECPVEVFYKRQGNDWLVYLVDITDQQKKEKKLTELAIRDPLTGLLNRRFLEELLSEEDLLKARYEGGPGLIEEFFKKYGNIIGVMMIDVNHFDLINNTSGHTAGDAVLRDVAQIIEREVRDSDIAIRYGGDEFLVLAPNCDKALESIAERIKQAVSEYSSKQKVTSAPVSVAIGYHYWDIRTQQSLAKAIHIADQRMYKDKNGVAQ
ncbi:hypothetical protein DRJ48_01990 [Candidatus Woesearchaeota archaeon]|nr:diguanylate cyclase [Candidatus Woesearchaeota archaeon]RLE43045.1 MAG: hypothetical protein DRJ48_01990 [Candidatus Woesearchaeota archaeon]